MKGKMMRKFLIFAAAAFAAYTPNILVAEQVAIGASGSGSGGASMSDSASPSSSMSSSISAAAAELEIRATRRGQRVNR